jgi:ribosomal-protein-alanine N-acetyltransferase
MILKGKKVILRYPKLSDAKWLFENITKPEIYLMLEPGIKPKQLKDEINWIRKLPIKRKSGHVNFVVVEKKSGKLMGGVGIKDPNFEQKRAELGAWIAKEYWGKGYAKEALTLLINYGFKKLKLNRLEGVCYESNKRSRNLQESLGFKLEGVLREHTIFKGKVLNDCFYSLLKKEWKG